jgi:acyl carrier protein
MGKDGSVRDFSFAQRRNVSGRSGSIIARAGKVMTKDEIKNPGLRIHDRIAPAADLTLIKLQVSFREQLDIDSMDFLKFAIERSKELGVEVPEADYPKVASLDDCVEYVMEKHAR